MGFNFFKEPELKNPIMICGWPGIGNIGYIAAETLRKGLDAEEFGGIESSEYFYPRKVIIKEGVLENLEFPTNKFYYKKLQTRDLLFFIGEEQPRGDRKVYQIGRYVIDVALKFGCQRIYTSGAAVAYIHHQMKPRVWVVPNKEYLLNEVKKYDNVILMSDIEGKSDQGLISGLNGLLIGLAKEAGTEAVCFMGEFPVYISHATPYPKGSKSVLEVLTKIIDIEFDLAHLEELSLKTEEEIEKIYQQIPAETREQIEKIKYTRPAESKPLTEPEKEKFFKEVEEFLKRRKEGGENSV